MATTVLTRGTTLPDSAGKADFHNLVDTATGVTTGIVNADIDAAAAIAATKLATISTAGKVDGAALTGFANIPSGAGAIPIANLSSVNDKKEVIFIIDGAGEAISTGIKGDIRFPFACTLNSWYLLADQSGSIVIDLWRDTLANFPPTDADSLCAAKEPTITTATNASDTSITDWTSDDIVAGDIVRVNVDSCTSITRCSLVLQFTRTA